MAPRMKRKEAAAPAFLAIVPMVAVAAAAAYFGSLFLGKRSKKSEGGLRGQKEREGRNGAAADGQEVFTSARADFFSAPSSPSAEFHDATLELHEEGGQGLNMTPMTPRSLLHKLGIDGDACGAAEGDGKEGQGEEEEGGEEGAGDTAAGGAVGELLRKADAANESIDMMMAKAKLG